MNLIGSHPSPPPSPPACSVVGFTPMSSRMSAAEVFLLLSNMFVAFDKLTDRFGAWGPGCLQRCCFSFSR